MTDVATPKARLTRDDYQALPEGPPYYELIQGELVEMTRPLRRHYRLVARLLRRWEEFLDAGPEGEVALEPNLYLPEIEDVYHPDLLYVAQSRRAICREQGVFGTPDVICEVLSPSTRRSDRYVKLDEFRQAGVPHVWLIEPEAPVVVEEYVLGEDGRYRLHVIVTAPEEWEPVAFPGWRVSLAELQAAAAPVEGEDDAASAG